MTSAAAPFDPTTNLADALAVLSDVAPGEILSAIAEAPSRIRRTIIVREFLGCSLAVARDASDATFARITR